MKKIILIVVGIIIALIVITMVVVAIFWPYSLFFFIGLQENSPGEDRELIKEAISKGDYKICDKVSKGYMMSLANPRRECYGAIIKKNADIKICDDSKKISGIIGRDDCYKIVAIETKDPVKCSLIGNSEIAAYCYDSVAQKSENYKVCDYINESDEWGGEKGRCYGYFVQKNGDFSICNNLINPTISDICYGFYLENVNFNLDFCKNFQTVKGKNDCFFVAARNIKDVKICDKIEGDNYTKEQCLLYSK